MEGGGAPLRKPRPAPTRASAGSRWVTREQLRPCELWGQSPLPWASPGPVRAARCSHTYVLVALSDEGADARHRPAGARLLGAEWCQVPVSPSAPQPLGALAPGSTSSLPVRRPQCGVPGAHAQPRPWGRPTQQFGSWFTVGPSAPSLSCWSSFSFFHVLENKCPTNVGGVGPGCLRPWAPTGLTQEKRVPGLTAL